MASDITLNHGTPGSFTVTAWNDEPDASNDVSSSVDLGATSPFELMLTIDLLGLAGGTGTCSIYAEFSDDNSNWPTTQIGNLVPVTTVQMNAATAVRKVASLPVLARYVRLRLYNNSGAAMGASGNAVAYVPISLDVA